MQKRVTVVIPNYNGMKYLKTCLDSLARQVFQEFDTIVVDNASADESRTFIRENYPWVRLIVMDKNTGFSGAVNRGIREAKTPYVILLNNDTEADRKFVLEMVQIMDSDERIFSANCKLVQFYNRDRLDDAGDLYTIVGWGFQRGVDHSSQSYNRRTDVFSACAAAAIYRRDVFKKIGLFDRRHFAYLEDIDVGYRARIAGYCNVYCPDAVVYHVGSGTSGSKYNSFKVRLSARNSIYLNYKNMPFLQLSVNMPFLLLGYLIKWRFFEKIGFANEYIDGLREGVKTCRKCRKVAFEKKNLKNYIRIQFDLVKNMFIYALEYGMRKLRKE